MFLYLFPYLTLYVMGTKKKCLNETFFLHTQNAFELNDKKTVIKFVYLGTGDMDPPWKTTNL